MLLQVTIYILKSSYNSIHSSSTQADLEKGMQNAIQRFNDGGYPNKVDQNSQWRVEQRNRKETQIREETQATVFLKTNNVQ